MTPVVPWPEIAGRMQRRIVRPPEVNPHIVVLAQTRGGKDHLIRWGILPAFPLARVLVLITKRGAADLAWAGWGNEVAAGELRGGSGLGPDGTPRYQIALTPGRVSGDQARRLLEQCAEEGHMIVVIGDAASLTDPVNRGGLGCEPIVTRMMDQGAGNGLTVIACANSASWAASGIKDQAAAVLVGRSGGDMAGLFADIAGLPKRNVSLGRGAERDTIAGLAPHWWLYTDHADGEPFARVTTPPPAGSWDERGLWPTP